MSDHSRSLATNYVATHNISNEETLILKYDPGSVIVERCPVTIFTLSDLLPRLCGVDG